MKKVNDEAGALTLIKQSKANPQQAAPDFLLRKGDVPGHEFHGNQYTAGGGKSDAAAIHPKLAAVAAKSIKDSRSKLFDTANNLAMMGGHPDPKVAAAAKRAEALVDQARQIMFDVDK